MKKATVIINEKNHGYASLNQWQSYFQSIYGERNEKIEDPEVVLSRVSENASKVAENLRRYKYGEAMRSLAHVFCWLCGFCSRTRRNLGKIVWRKYPYVCPYCRRDKEDEVKSCTCLGYRVEIEEAPSHKKAKIIDEETLSYFRGFFKNKKPATLDRWVRMFEKLYRNSNYSASIEHIGFHLMEEIGEVSRAWRRKQEFEQRVQKRSERDTQDIEKARKKFDVNVDYEIADVFSWICALINKITWIVEAVENYGKSTMEIRMPPRRPRFISLPKVTLSSYAFSEYKDGCPNCGSPKCSEDCFLTECEFFTEKKKCGFEWKEVLTCDYGKTIGQSHSCGKVFLGANQE